MAKQGLATFNVPQYLAFINSALLVVYTVYGFVIYIFNLGEQSTDILLVMPFLPIIGHNGAFLYYGLETKKEYFKDKLSLVYLPIGFFMIAMFFNGYQLYQLSHYF